MELHANVLQEISQGQSLEGTALKEAKDALWELFQGDINKSVEFGPDSPFSGVISESFANQIARVRERRKAHSLQFIPKEIRRQIFRYLLTNPELGEASTVSQSADYGANAKYELSPAILRVCKSFHEEGLSILYGSNIFFIEFLPEVNEVSLDVRLPITTCSPLTRWINGSSDKRRPGEVLRVSSEGSYLVTIPAITCVRKWRIVLSGKTLDGIEGHHVPNFQLEFILLFSRILGELQVKTRLLTLLEFVYVPKGIEEAIDYQG